MDVNAMGYNPYAQQAPYPNGAQDAPNPTFPQQQVPGRFIICVNILLCSCNMKV